MGNKITVIWHNAPTSRSQSITVIGISFISFIAGRFVKFSLALNAGRAPISHSSRSSANICETAGVDRILRV